MKERFLKMWNKKYQKAQKNERVVFYLRHTWLKNKQRNKTKHNLTVTSLELPSSILRLEWLNKAQKSTPGQYAACNKNNSFQHSWSRDTWSQESKELKGCTDLDVRNACNKICAAASSMVVVTDAAAAAAAMDAPPAPAPPPGGERAVGELGVDIQGNGGLSGVLFTKPIENSRIYS